MPNASRAAAAATCSVCADTTAAAPSTTTATRTIDSSCPIAIGTSARSAARRSRCCMPWETANSQPIAGFSP